MNNWDYDIYTPNLDIDMDNLEEKAWEIYCYETRGGLDVKDFWWELHPDQQDFYKSKAYEQFLDGDF
jgi:hypothetical protein